mmetsp:Transcript_960/g.2143  ORF Transcript_960/g.2143 Transcript_960/m.2143 type:complete len:1691 (+) Transcript_960:303-5375(+)
MGPKKKLLGGKKDDSDSDEKEDAKEEGKAEAVKSPRSDEGGDNKEEKGGGLKRGGKKSTRFKKDDSDEEEEESDWKAEAAKRKADKEKAKQEREELRKAKEKMAEEEIQEEAGEGEEGKDEEAGAEGEGGEGLQRTKEKRTRFSKASSGEQNDEAEAFDEMGSLFERHKEAIPWVPTAKRVEKEKEVYLRLGKRETVLKEARSRMREQGLYVAGERRLLPANVERDLLRSKMQREAKAERLKLAIKAGGATPAKEGEEGGATKTFVDPKSGVEFSAEDEQFLVPFEPLKERVCRPAMRYDPTLPYMLYDTIVPVTNLDAVFGHAASTTLLDLEVRRVTLTDHPLFIEEDYYACELESLNRKYQRRSEIDWVDFYSQKLDALTSALETVRRERDMHREEGPLQARKGKDAKDKGGGAADAIVKAADTLMHDQELEEEVRQARLQRAQEEYEDLALVSRMITVWEKLKKVRADQGFTSTRVDLKFKKKNMSLQKDEEQRQHELDAELGEKRRKHEQDLRAKETSWEVEQKKIQDQVDKLNSKIAALQEQEAQANMGVPVDDDEEDDEDNDDDLDDEAVSPGSPDKAAKKKRTVTPADQRLATKLLDERMAEEEMLEKTKELLERHNAKQPKASDDPFDESAAIEEIKEKHKRTKRNPGSPIYIPMFNDQRSRTETGSLPATPEGEKEKKRRGKIKSMQLFLRILVNGRPLTNPNGRDFEADLVPVSGAGDSSFSFVVKQVVQLAPTSGMPQIVLQLHERGWVYGGTEVAVVVVPVDEEAPDDRGDPLVFQGLTPWESEAKGYWQGGEGVKDFKPTHQHYYTGNMFVRLNQTVTRGTDGAGMLREGAMLLDRGSKRRAPLMGGGVVSAHKLKKMIKHHLLDPNDPKNNHLLELLSASKEQENEKHVRFDSKMASAHIGESIKLSTKDSTVLSTRWVGEQALSCPATMRHKLLMAREKSPAVFQGSSWVDRAVPLLENEIDDDDTRRDEFFDRVYASEFPEADEEGQRSVDNKKAKKVLQFRQKVQQQVRKQRAKAGSRQKKRYKLEDVVHQPALPEFGGFAIIEAIKYFLRKRSNLRPDEKPAKPVSAAPTECYIRITVQRAQNLPVRRPDAGPGSAAGAASGGGDGGEESTGVLESIVQARFQNHETDRGSDTTPVAKGPAPAWNAPLKLRFTPWNNNWMPGNLARVTDTLHLNVFDTKVWEKPDPSGQMRKVEKRWLGSIQFPFHTLYTTGRIDGTFELDCPPHHIGYTRDSKGGGGGGKKNRRPTTIQLCIALDPPLPQPSAVTDLTDLSTKLHGQQQLVRRLTEWMAECSRPSHCRNRKFEPIGRTLIKDYVLACRFLTPQAPPPDAYNQSEGFSKEKQMLQLCRFVSLIPFLEDFHLEDTGGDDIDAESLDIWCTSAEFIDIMAGDWEEHATLLCNFFLHLKHEAYLVFGSGIPEGDTVYVMTKERVGDDIEVFFWNASRGKRYNSKDIHCTLKEVYYVVDQHNVWGNVQATRSIPSTKFDLGDSRCWKRLFNDKNPQSSFPQMDTVQDDIDWKLSQPREAYSEEVAKRIKLAVRNRLEHWRSREGKSLVGNEGATRKLNDVMRKMEQAAHQEAEFTEENLHAELETYLQPKSSTTGFNMTGFYVNRPFTDLEPILDEIYNADIHHAGPVVTDGSESDTQFAHTVYVRCFPRRILSVWICVACLSRKR